MKAEANIREYNDLDKNYRRSQVLANGVQVDFFVQIGSEKFVDYQKELFEEFLANFLNQAANSDLTENEIELLAETELKKLMIAYFLLQKNFMICQFLTLEGIFNCL